MAIIVKYDPNKGLTQERSDVGGIFILLNQMSQLVVTKTTNYEIGAEPIIFGDCSSGNITFTLPDASDNQNNIFEIKKIDASGFTLTISGSNSQTIDGSLNQSINTQYTSIKVIASGTGWYIL